MSNLACDYELWWCKAIFVRRRANDLTFDFHTVEVLEVVEVEVCATQLAICYGADAVLEFFLDEVGDVSVFCGAEVLLGGFASYNVLADFEDFFWTEEGADVLKIELVVVLYEEGCS